MAHPFYQPVITADSTLIRPHNGDRVLIFDVDMRPISIIPWQDGAALVTVKEPHELMAVVDFYYEIQLGNRGAPREKRVVYVPTAIKLNYKADLDNIDRPASVSKHGVIARDKNTCAYCGQSFPTGDLTVDHVIPKSRGGDDSWTNLIAACGPCNQRKADRLPREANMYPRWQPKPPPPGWRQYRSHIRREWRPLLHTKGSQ